MGSFLVLHWASPASTDLLHPPKGLLVPLPPSQSLQSDTSLHPDTSLHHWALRCSRQHCPPGAHRQVKKIKREFERYIWRKCG